MRAVDILAKEGKKTRRLKGLAAAEIKVVSSMASRRGDIPDYQMSAFLMAILPQGHDPSGNRRSHAGDGGFGRESSTSPTSAIIGSISIRRGGGWGIIKRRWLYSVGRFGGRSGSEDERGRGAWVFREGTL